MTEWSLEQLCSPIEAQADATALDRLRAATTTAEQLRRAGDELLDRYVQAARADGCSWADIGAALGVSKQAAHERFVDAPLMWPIHFNPPARATVARALAEARAFGHPYLGTEHLLLALTLDDGLGGTTLATFGITEAAVRDAIERTVGHGSSQQSPMMGVSPRTKRVFEAARKEAKRLSRQDCADTEHLLLALSGNPGVAREILGAHKVDDHAIRTRLAPPRRRRGRG
jgi:hypothetical protein